MAHVTIPRPWHVRANALAARILPHTTPGWAFAVLLLANTFRGFEVALPLLRTDGHETKGNIERPHDISGVQQI
jgi:hypothetical protein